MGLLCQDIRSGLVRAQRVGYICNVYFNENINCSMLDCTCNTPYLNIRSNVSYPESLRFMREAETCEDSEMKVPCERPDNTLLLLPCQRL